MSIAFQIGQLLFFLLLFSATFIFVVKGKGKGDWRSTLEKLVGDIQNDFRHIFANRIFTRLDSINNRYEQHWERNRYVLRAADEHHRVSTELYADLYKRLIDSLRESQELGKRITLTFQEMDAFVQQCSILHLVREAIRVELKKSRLDDASNQVEQLGKVIGRSREIIDHIKDVPVELQRRMNKLRKGIKLCLLENIDVVESVKEERIKIHLRNLARILEKREEFSVELAKIVQCVDVPQADKLTLSEMHNWLIKSEEELDNARAEFRALNQAFSDLTLMEKQVQSWYAKYEAVKEKDLFEGMIVEDLEKRVVALKELWQGYEQDIRRVEETSFEDRKQRMKFVLDEVERFDQDINFVGTCRTGVEDRLKWLQKMGDINEWIKKTTSLCPFTVTYNESESVAQLFEKAILGWDNPRPYEDVEAFVEHAKRMEEEIDRCRGGISTLKERYRLVKHIENFHSTLKDGLLKQQTSATLVLYQYVFEELQVKTIEWGPFEELLEQIDILLQDNPVASAQRHDPIDEENIQSIYEQVESFKSDWEQALLAIQENYKLLQSMLRKDLELMGTQWLKFMFSIRDTEPGSYISPYNEIDIAQPTGKLHDVLNNDGFHKRIAELDDTEMVAYHRELSRLSENMNEAIDKAEQLAIKQRGEGYSAPVNTVSASASG